MKIKTLVAAVLLLSGGATSVLHKTIVMRTVVFRMRQ